VYRDPQDRFSVLAMVWGSGQGTPIHDHGGMWCVEGVYEGKILVTSYNRVESDVSGLFQFLEHHQVEEGIGGTGSLIPPVEFHTIENPGPEDAITVHIYGGELTQCRVFVPLECGRYQPSERDLGYTSQWPGEIH